MKTNMNNINASSLFHFTRRFSTIQKIVRNGIRFSYAFESLIYYNTINPIAPILENPDNPLGQRGVAIPMISFCDIPIVRASNHINRYGEYMIGVDKNAIINRINEIVNPVLYVESKNLYSAIKNLSSMPGDMLMQMLKMNSHVMGEGDAINPKTIMKGIDKYVNHSVGIEFIMGLIKPVNDPFDKYCYYDEREWRAFLPDNHAEKTGWKWDVSREIHKNNKNTWNEELANSNLGYLKLFPNEITHIVVKSESQVPKMINLLLKSKALFGHLDVGKEDRFILVSKVTSLERIALDY